MLQFLVFLSCAAHNAKQTSFANIELYLAKETSMDWPCFETWWTFAWNYWRQNDKVTNKREKKNSNVTRFGKW